MPRSCTICTHPDRDAIDRALVHGAPFRDIAGHFHVAKSALERHKVNHLPATLVQAEAASDAARADDLLHDIRSLQARTLAILATAERKGELRTALAAIGQARGNLELLARLLGELQEGAIVNVVVTPEWQALRTLLVRALEPYPESKAAVLTALNGAGVDSGD